jgi:hypothetical protein
VPGLAITATLANKRRCRFAPAARAAPARLNLQPASIGGALEFADVEIRLLLILRGRFSHARMRAAAKDREALTHRSLESKKSAFRLQNSGD